MALLSVPGTMLGYFQSLTSPGCQGRDSEGITQMGCVRGTGGAPGETAGAFDRADVRVDAAEQFASTVGVSGTNSQRGKECHTEKREENADEVVVKRCPRGRGPHATRHPQETKPRAIVPSVRRLREEAGAPPPGWQGKRSSGASARVSR